MNSPGRTIFIWIVYTDSKTCQLSHLRADIAGIRLVCTKLKNKIVYLDMFPGRLKRVAELPRSAVSLEHNTIISHIILKSKSLQSRNRRPPEIS